MSSRPPDFYQILGVEKDASVDEIKKSFRQLARKHHPDVAGNSPEAKARFDEVREAYETLVDPEKRAEYERMRKRSGFRQVRGHGPGWRPPGGHDFGGGASRQKSSVNTRAWNQRQNNMGLDDIFGEDFGFGGANAGPRMKTGPSNLRGERGRDITMFVDVPHDKVRRGGLVTVEYRRQMRNPGGGANATIDELHELRLPPGVQNGDVLRVPGHGDAGPGGGPYGDLLCQVRVVEASSAGSAPRSTNAGTDGEMVVPISVTEALLGGRVAVETPTGSVKLTIPPGTSSHARLRLRGKGAGGKDLFVVVQIMVPTSLDAESEALVRKLAELNPLSPRG